MARNLTVRDPLLETLSLRDAMTRLVDESFVRPTTLLNGNGVRPGLVPAANVWEDEDAFGVELSIPGVDASQLEVTFENDSLTISGAFKGVEEKRNWLLIERPEGSFRRSFRLGVAVDSAQAEASCEDGVLSIRVPKSEGVKPRRIEVKSGD